MQKVDDEISRLVALLRKEQDRDGSWKYCLESSLQTDAYMIILLRTLQIHDEELIRSLSKRILNHRTRFVLNKVYWITEGWTYFLLVITTNKQLDHQGGIRNGSSIRRT